MDNEENESFIEHIEALRQTLLRCIYALALVLPFMLFLAPEALDMLIDFISDGIKLNYFTPVEVFLIRIKMALVLDLIICFPYIAKQIWNFILPALYEHERKFIKSAVVYSVFLFICGAAFCIFLILPLIMRFGMSFENHNLHPMFGISNIINLSLGMSVVFGLMFQMPLAVFALIKSGVVDYETIADKRPYVVVGLLIISAVLTPPDIISQIMLAVPTYLLFESGLFCAKYKYLKK